MFNDARCRSSLENLNNFVRRGTSPRRTLHFQSLLTLWLGGLRSSITLDIAVLNTSGWRHYPTHRSCPLTPHNSFCWETTECCWAIANWSKDDGAKVRFLPAPTTPVLNCFNTQVIAHWMTDNRDSSPLIMWMLIPVEQGSPPSYEEEATGQSTHSQRTESERDDFGTIVTEVVTTRRRYRIEDA